MYEDVDIAGGLGLDRAHGRTAASMYVEEACEGGVTKETMPEREPCGGQAADIGLDGLRPACPSMNLPRASTASHGGA